MRPNLRTEQEIMKTWKGTKPVVSICCLAYNHEPYIEDALEGFLIQETDFPFEVLIHDDASTDRTADIIREYEAAYPHIIKPIYQTINQFTHGGNITIRFQYPRAQGEYIAICEGDDYWISPIKLQNQVEALNKHPEINICFHSAKCNKNGKISRDELCHYSDYEKIFTLEETILGDGGFMPTPAVMFRSKVIPKLITFFKSAGNTGVGDLFTQIIASNPNGSLFIPYTFSTYRMNAKGSWTTKNSNNYQYRLQNNILIIKALINLNNQIGSKSSIFLNQLRAKYLIGSSFAALVTRKYKIFTELYEEAISITNSKIPAQHFYAINHFHKYPKTLSFIIRNSIKLRNFILNIF